MSKDKLDILEKLHKDKVNKMSQKGNNYRRECEESERYIKEMQQMELKRESKYNMAITIIVGAFLVLCIILVANSISHRRHASKVKVASEQKQQVVKKDNEKKSENTQNNKDNSKDKNEDKKGVDKEKEDKKDEVKYYEKIASSLNDEPRRKKILANALSLNGGKYEGINIKYMVAILRANGVNVSPNITRTDTLVSELEKSGWKKNTNPAELKKGDIVFTTDSIGIKGVPSYCYIFMNWENSKKENGFIVDGLLTKQNVTYHQRPITVQSEKTDKFQFFMRK